MKIFKIAVMLVALALCFSCKSKLPENYHMDRRYWNLSDYDEAINYIKYSIPEGQGYPRLTDPLTAPVFIKLVDKQNVSVILEDNSLGLKHKRAAAEGFFKYSEDMMEIYRKFDKQDKFIYPIELVKATEFGLHTQLLYFKVGNDAILKDALNIEDAEVKNVIRRNEQAIADNFDISLKLLAKEDAFNDAAIKEYAVIIDAYFSKLIKDFTKADYSAIKNTATALKTKVKSQDLKKTLSDLIDKIDKKQ
jgi:hypothetical protein